MSFQTSKSFVHLRNTIEYILDENNKTCDCPIDSQVNNIVKAHCAPRDRRAILENIRWMQTVYAVLCQLHLKDTLDKHK